MEYFCFQQFAALNYVLHSTHNKTLPWSFQVLPPHGFVLLLAPQPLEGAYARITGTRTGGGRTSPASTYPAAHPEAG